MQELKYFGHRQTYLVFSQTEFRVTSPLQKIRNQIAHLILDFEIESESSWALVLGLANVTWISH